MRERILNLPASKIASMHRSVLEQCENGSNKNKLIRGKKNKNDENVDKSADKTQRQESKKISEKYAGKAVKNRDGREHVLAHNFLIY